MYTIYCTLISYFISNNYDSIPVLFLHPVLSGETLGYDIVYPCNYDGFKNDLSRF